ncbi:membrane alanyl aminopeptidase-like [Phlebotomus argentipes]|uniref:membrane alanyl aminopeptidase-like n=1 Tax=Phlebotomus argentipes TaxID=94469 RepID=UPI0028931C1D|nr:membrane alanyl aminopeptidase-like [Phlebotomus argentipes]
MTRVPLILLVTFVLTNFSEADVSRLNFKIRPMKYSIFVNFEEYDINQEKPWTFQGVVNILIQIYVDDVRSITLNSFKLNIFEQHLKLKCCNTDNLLVGKPTYNPDKQQVTFDLKESLNKSSEIILSMKYRGEISNDKQGMFKTIYDSETEKRQIIMTVLEPHFARTFMPCFDEPRMKAQFKLKVRRAFSMSVLSNMPLLNSVNDDFVDFTNDTFKTTPPISTYMLALFMAESQNFPAYEVNSTINIISRTEMQQHREYAASIAPKILEYFDFIFDLPYKEFMPKIDIVAVPNFTDLPTENPGLITLRESALLYSPEKTSATQQRFIMELLMHKLAHTWFGNLVTISKWKDLWLNVGFAKFFESFSIPCLKISEDFPTLFTVHVMHEALDFDSSNVTHAMGIDNFESYEDIVQKYDTISYNKAASVIRMWQHHLGPDLFGKVMVQYLKEKKLKTTEPSVLLKIMESVKQDEQNHTKAIFQTYTRLPNYPIIEVNINKVRNSANLTQSNYCSECRSEENDLWAIPITFVSKRQYNFSDTATKAVLIDQLELKLDAVPNSWVIFNVQQVGYYRVKYDLRSWRLILKGLNSPNFDGIHEINRAQIIDDMMHMAKLDLLAYSVVFSALEYLQKETHYVPWKAALNSFKFLSYRLRDQDRDVFGRFILKTIENVYNQVGFFPIPSDSYLTRYLRIDIAEWACTYGHSDCLYYARQQYRYMKTSGSHEIPVDIRETVFCTFLRDGGVKEFNFLWKRFKSEILETEQIRILNSLGCTNTDKSVELLMSKIFSPEIDDGLKKDTFLNAVSRNQENVHRIWSYIIENHEKMSRNLIHGYIDVIQYIATVAKFMKNSQQLSELEEFIENTGVKLKTYKDDLEKAAEIVKRSLQWNDRNLDEVILQIEMLASGNIFTASKLLLMLTYVNIIHSIM